ncbi:Diadenosine tetraphosphate (Ap4A) hydrolase and other HIT family hydrolases [hydrothermal vent metagenome]|uniref:Diadenosine tetraphosphate (Ap4A) hydrolase and other HIT family hydrolases n=1 Tax=hydrothermal vent metagenome TaxID=652676 RepID=A0A3B0XBX2_9ZZZZ
MIKLHPQLEKDCIVLGEFSLCTLLLLNDSNYPWFILLPNRENLKEIHQLSNEDQQQFMAESMFLSRCLEQVFNPDKLNVAALGNVVPQLHIHHIARFIDDASWPAPVWGAVPTVPYQTEQVNSIKNQLVNYFSNNSEQLFHHL